MGAEIYLYLAIEGVEAYNVEASKGENVKNDVIARVSSRSSARAGDRIQIAIDSSRIHLFDKDTQKVIIH
jgi:multiple sugar transport system ATP-binding protein